MTGKADAKTVQRVPYFELEDGYILVPEQYDWALARLTGYVRPDRQSEVIEYYTFHKDVPSALKAYHEMRLRQAAARAMHGTIYDLVDILIEQQKKTQELYKKLCAQMEVLK